MEPVIYLHAQVWSVHKYIKQADRRCQWCDIQLQYFSFFLPCASVCVKEMLCVNNIDLHELRKLIELHWDMCSCALSLVLGNSDWKMFVCVVQNER